MLKQSLRDTSIKVLVYSSGPLKAQFRHKQESEAAQCALFY
jgi:hypothetical protein